MKGWEASILLSLPLLASSGKIAVLHVGLLGAVMSVCQIFSNLHAGHLSEKFGSKQVLLLGLGAYVLSWFLFSLSATLPLFFLVYVLAGVGIGIFIPLANAAVAKLSETRRAKEMGHFSAYTDLGRVLFSPMSIFLLGAIGFFSTSLIFSLTGTLLLVILFLISKKEKTPTPVKKANEKIYTHHLVKEKKYVFATLTGVFDGFASASLYIFIPLLLVPKGIAITSVGLLSSLFFLGYFSGRLLLGILADRYGAEKTLIAAEICMAALIVALVFASHIVIAALLLFLLGMVTRGTSPVIRAMVADAVGDKKKFDKAYGLYSFSVNSSSVASRSLFGGIASTLGIASVFYVAGAVAIATILPIILYNRQHK